MGSNAVIEQVDKRGLTLSDAVELMAVVKMCNEQKFPRLTEEEFCINLFGYMKLNGMYEFDVDSLESFIQEKMEDEKFRLVFSDIHFRTVIQEGISNFEIIGAVCRDLSSFGTSKVRIRFLREEALEIVQKSVPVYQKYINELAQEYCKRSMGDNFKVKSLGKK